MITLKTVLDAARLPSSQFDCAENPIILLDRKERIIEENVHFHDSLFKNNPTALQNFSAFLAHMAKSTSPIHVKIDEHSVIFFPHTPHSRIFLRHSISPMDFME